MDEVPEFPRSTLELLRGPLEEREVVLSRASGHVRFPASSMLVATANPCPCGFFGHPIRPCVCTDAQRQRYKSRLSGPFLDRMDLWVAIASPEEGCLGAGDREERSSEIRTRVNKARAAQSQRFECTPFRTNAEVRGVPLNECIRLEKSAHRIIEHANTRFSLTGRGRDRILRVARTIADLKGASVVCRSDLAEALSFRTAMRGWA